eukprot:TRINITY_DN4_c1_g2_i1.p1 TRINITY_DN4_c1_g2~~TRINITY_DN4_c1_g2_i1.p1  ORF type:complete len:619 (+),score=220.86 TRINITY_DN4_c1_g2_i1:57-1913(+)
MPSAAMKLCCACLVALACGVAGGGVRGGRGAPVMGIDLGATYSSVGVWQDGEVHILRNEWGSPLTPSVVGFSSKERLVGERAVYDWGLNPDSTIHNVKRLLGKMAQDPEVQQAQAKALLPFTIAEGQDGKPVVSVMYRDQERLYTPIEVTAMILANLKARAEEYAGQRVTDAVITVPAYFSNAQRQATKDAAGIAGLNVLRILNEPTAAVLAYNALFNATAELAEKNCAAEMPPPHPTAEERKTMREAEAAYEQCLARHTAAVEEDKQAQRRRRAQREAYDAEDFAQRQRRAAQQHAADMNQARHRYQQQLQRQAQQQRYAHPHARYGRRGAADVGVTRQAMQARLDEAEAAWQQEHAQREAAFDAARKAERARWEAALSAQYQTETALPTHCVAPGHTQVEEPQPQQPPQPRGKKHVVVYDIGGGGADASVIQVDQGGLVNVVATAGDMGLGGADLTARMVQHYLRVIWEAYGADLREDRVALSALFTLCEAAKRRLSFELEASIEAHPLPTTVPTASPIVLDSEMTRAEFEALNEPLFAQAMAPIAQALADASLRPADVDEVVLVGGAARMPKVRALVEETFGRSPHTEIHPDEAVTYGATLHAALMAGQSGTARH